MNFNTTGSNNTCYRRSIAFHETLRVILTQPPASGHFLKTLRGNFNTATGVSAMSSNTTGNNNTTTGFQSLSSNTTGEDNVAVGLNSLFQKYNREKKYSNGDEFPFFEQNG